MMNGGIGLILLCCTISINAFSLVTRKTFFSESFALLSLSTVEDSRKSNFVYSDTWIGTQLPLLPLQDSAQLSRWEMGRWPDPILRRPSTPVDSYLFGSPSLATASRLLEETARREGAVGLAAQQCGVDARLVYLDGYGVLVNPRIVRRSPETAMRVWQEQCLVLPPTFVATVLRDAWVDLQFWTVEGSPKKIRLQGESSRCIQHELGKLKTTTTTTKKIDIYSMLRRRNTNLTQMRVSFRSRPRNSGFGSHRARGNGKRRYEGH